LPYFFQRDIVNGDLSKPTPMMETLNENGHGSIWFATTIAKKRGGDTAVLSKNLEECLAANLAGAPGSEMKWKTLNEAESETKLAYGFSELRPIGIPTATSDQEIIRQLLKVTSRKSQSSGGDDGQPQLLSSLAKTLTDAMEELKKAKAAAQLDETAIATAKLAFETAKAKYREWNYYSKTENKDLTDRLLEETLARTHSIPQVKAARFVVALIQGAEQLGMLILGVWLACLLVVRCRNMFVLVEMKEWKKIVKSNLVAKADDAKDFVISLFALEPEGSEKVHEDVETRFERIRRVNFEGRWLMRWIAQALPAVGFIGTVRGISAGLGSADAIVRAENVIGQAAAINQVAGSLGVAFTTTLIALVFGLALGILERLEASFENGVLSRLETACVIGSGAQNS
jgi:biopolymer transport protein ExbB/TolQ/cell division protein ZapA (FtsZ GTPase activity inhibitor)